MVNTDIVRLKDNELAWERKTIDDWLKKNKPSVVSHPPMPKNGGVRESSHHVVSG